MAHEDVSFMKKAAQSGMLEVELGGQAVEKASTPEVKAFGTRMVVDHGKANQELKGIAASKNITLPSDLNDDAKKDVERLSRLSGDAFERAYAALMVEEHEKDVKDFRAAARYVKDADVRAWAAKTAPVLEDHLRHAREVKSELEPTVGAR